MLDVLLLERDSFALGRARRGRGGNFDAGFQWTFGGRHAASHYPARFAVY